MSGYINFDHAGWVESQIRASKRHKPTAKDRRNMEKGLGWGMSRSLLKL